jgi:hypothetical protein
LGKKIEESKGKEVEPPRREEVKGQSHHRSAIRQEQTRHPLSHSHRTTFVTSMFNVGRSMFRATPIPSIDNPGISEHF